MSSACSSFGGGGVVVVATVTIASVVAALVAVSTADVSALVSLVWQVLSGLVKMQFKPWTRSGFCS